MKKGSIILSCFILLLVICDIVAVVISARSDNADELAHSLFFLLTFLLIVVSIVRYKHRNIDNE